MSTHEVKIVKIEEILPHSGADRLELIKVWDYICVVGKGQFKVGDLAAYFEPDTKVPLDREEFAFLKRPESTKTHHRIAVSRLRGVYSSGLLLPAPKGFKENDNAWDYYSVERWEPAEQNFGGSKGGGSLGSSIAEKGPEFHCPHYDLENVKKYKNVVQPGEEVILTSKIHGSSAKFVFSKNKFFCGSRNMWKKAPGHYWLKPKGIFNKMIMALMVIVSGDNPEIIFNFFKKMPFRSWRQFNQRFTGVVTNNAWWQAAKNNPWIEKWCRANPDVVIYGEICGPNVQGEKFHYGFKDGEIGFFVFDILEDGKWIPNEEFDKPRYNMLKFVPTLYRGPYDINIVAELAEKKEDFNDANHIREGVVIKAVGSREQEHFGRVALKYVSNTYLEKS